MLCFVRSLGSDLDVDMFEDVNCMLNRVEIPGLFTPKEQVCAVL